MSDIKNLIAKPINGNPIKVRMARNKILFDISWQIFNEISEKLNMAEFSHFLYTFTLLQKPKNLVRL